MGFKIVFLKDDTANRGLHWSFGALDDLGVICARFARIFIWATMELNVLFSVV